MHEMLIRLLKASSQQLESVMLQLQLLFPAARHHNPLAGIKPNHTV